MGKGFAKVIAGICRERFQIYNKAEPVILIF